MPALSFADDVAIAKIVYYAPCLVASLVVCWRHGFTKASGWLFLTIFCILRLVGASAELVTISNPSEGAVTTAEIASLIGLSPLLLATLGLLTRLYTSILKSFWGTLFQLGFVRVIQIPTVVALVLSIVGFTNAPSVVNFSSEGTIQASVIIYLVVLVVLILLTAGAAVGRRTTHRGEAMILAVIAISLPFLVVRVSYSLAETFSGDRKFNPLIGSQPIQLCMVTLEEAVVVAAYLWAGMRLAAAVPEGEASNSAGGNIMYRAGRGDFGGGKLGLLSLLIHIVQEVTSGRARDIEEQTANPKYEGDRQHGIQ